MIPHQDLAKRNSLQDDTKIEVLLLLSEPLANFLRYIFSLQKDSI